MNLIDRYLLRQAFWPMVGATGVTLVALLLERVLRLLELLSNSSDRFGFVARLAVNLVPHYMGLTLPVAFFIALVIVVNRMNEASEVDALLAAGVSLSRIARPFLALAAILAIFSLVVFGFLQPYSRYAYRAVLHAAQNAGWSGQVPEGMIVSPDRNLTMTADETDPAGQRLKGVFIRRLTKSGREEVTTAGMAELRRSADGKSVQLILQDGQQLRFDKRGQPQLLGFTSFTMDLPLTGPEKLLRARGGDERELNFFELATQERNTASIVPHRTLTAEMYARLSRSLSLPLLPMLALPLGLAAKRSGRAPGIIVGGVLLLTFHQLISLGESFAERGKLSPEVGVLGPFLLFGLICFTVFFTSRKRPGETPVGRAMEFLARVAARLRPKRASEGQAA